MYASRDDRLTTRFSDNFNGCTGSGAFLVKDRAEWVKITRQDFSQVTGRIRMADAAPYVAKQSGRNRLQSATD